MVAQHYNHSVPAFAMMDFEDSNTDHRDNENDEFVFLLVATQCIINNNLALIHYLRRRRLRTQQRFRIMRVVEEILLPPDHRHLPRQQKAVFRHHEALICIKRDYFGIPGDLGTPIFKDQTFQMMFRLSRSRVQRLFEDIMTTNHPFYANSMDAYGKKGASLESKVLLPLKTFAYGVPPHTFTDYFQMSKGLAATCCDEFAATMKLLYDEEYLRIPSTADLNMIITLHKERHGVNGMFGSLDCMHNGWKNCPKAWQASFKTGKESGGPTVVLEALCDYNLWFWHASFGYAGSLNDLNILNLSPFLESLVDGTFSELERSCGKAPYEISGSIFHRFFALVDGIYPPYSRFVKGIQMPLTDEEKRYTAWQEAARKDIERAFGVLQSRFQVMARPFLGHCLKKVSTVVSACLIMHNMCVSDRIMEGNVYARYNPANNVMEDEVDVGIENENGAETAMPTQIGLANADHANVIDNVLARQNHWREVNDATEHARLHSALRDLKGTRGVQ